MSAPSNIEDMDVRDVERLGTVIAGLRELEGNGIHFNTVDFKFDRSERRVHLARRGGYWQDLKLKWIRGGRR